MADTPLLQGASSAADGNAMRLSTWVCLAAAPCFAIMALVSGVLGEAPASMLCLATHNAWRPTGMVPMYLLMSVVHAAPWLKLISGHFSGARSRLQFCRSQKQ